MEIDEILCDESIPRKDKQMKETGVGQALNNAAGGLINQANNALTNISQIGNSAFQQIGQMGTNFIKNKQNKNIADTLMKAIEPVEEALSLYIQTLSNQGGNQK